MVFATIGTSEPFDRLVRALDALPDGEDLVVQTGLSLVRLRRATYLPFLPYGEVVAHVRRARVVVTHAGAGSVMTCLGQGKRPIVVPRLRRFGETADDHQLTFGRRLAAAGLVTLVEDTRLLADAVQTAPGAPPSPLSTAESLTGDLRLFLAEAVGRMPKAGQRP